MEPCLPHGNKRIEADVSSWNKRGLKSFKGPAREGKRDISSRRKRESSPFTNFTNEFEYLSYADSVLGVGLGLGEEKKWRQTSSCVPTDARTMKGAVENNHVRT